ATPYEGRERKPFQGGVEQIVADLAAHASVGLEEILIDLQDGARDAEELKDVAAEVYTAARAAGL
ncbi:LLM class F420-dependent oxidoreductase, partial [Streptomyces decoyicus]